MPSKLDPPSESSSSSESEEEEDPQEPKAQDEKEEEEEDEDEEEEEEEEVDPTPVKPTKPTPTSNSTPHKTPQPPSDSSESDSDDESDSPTPTPTQAPLNIKPISSKPMSSSSRPTIIGLASAKRPLPEEKSSRKDRKKKKKVSELVDEKNEHKKNVFQRVWTEEDEIAILNGMITFKKKDVDLNSQFAAFFDTIKDSLHTNDVSKTQLHSKIRTLKKKFLNAAKKAKPGENLKPHDEKVYQLSKKIWEVGKDEVDEGGDDKKSKTKSKSKSKSKSKEVVVPDGVATLSHNVTTTKKKSVKVEAEYLYLGESSVAHKFPMMPVPPIGLGDIVSKRGWDVIGSSKAQKFDQRWKSVIIAETKAYLQRLDLVKEQTQAMLDALESSDA